METEVPYLFVSNTTDIFCLNVIGVVISLYSLHIELRKEKDPSYKAWCDFNEWMSCSKVLTSKYSIGFGVMHVFFGRNHVMNSRNCNLGLVFYLINILAYLFLPPSVSASFQFYGSVISVVGCLYLAFVLVFVLKDFCLVCVTIYVINGALLYASHALWRQHQVKLG